MSTNIRRIFFAIVLLSVVGGLYYFQKINLPVKKVSENIDDKYVMFDLEVYDQIAKTYWNKLSEEDLSNLFKLSVEKALSTTTSLYSKDKAGVEKMLRKALALASTTEQKKQLAITTAGVALYNIPPAGRNQLLTQKQEKQFRDTVANINPAKDLYSDIGVKTGSTKEEVKQGYEAMLKAYKNATSGEDKAKVEKAKYAYGVLSNDDSKTLYDQAKVEPTLKHKIIGTTFYADLSQIAPTTLFELVKA
ncbi:MAG: hypothetical protein WAW92_02750, partial [Minisyncoccia bacterium]